MMHPAEAERLLRQTDWLRALAQSILGDAHAAADVAQDAWVAALERPPRVADEGAWRAWLGEVTCNLARTRLRREGRRVARERAVAGADCVAGVDEALQRVTTQRALVDAVLALEPADRDVVVLRYFEGLPPRRIARELGTSSAAVRSRLSRALAKLRARLGDEGGLDARALVLVAKAGSGAASALPGLLGGLFLNTTAKLALVGGTLLAGLVWFTREGGAPAASSPEAPEAVVSSDAVHDDASTQQSADASSERAVDVALPSSAASEIAPASERSTGTVSGQRVVVRARIVDAAGDPLEGASLTAVDLREPVSATSSADGRVQLEIPWPMHLVRGNDSWAVVQASFPGFTRANHQARLEGPAEIEVGDLRLEPGGDVDGRIVDANGKPIAGAFLYVVGGALPGAPDLEEERRVRGWPFPSAGSSATTSKSAEDGSYRLEGVPARSLSIVARAGGTYAAYTAPIDVPAGGEARAPDLVLRPIEAKNAIRGVVVDARGPVPRAEVLAYENRGRRNTQPLAMMVTDEAGRFELLVVSESIHTLQATDLREHGREVLVHDVRAGDSSVRIAFPEKRTIRVAAIDANDQPIADVWLQVWEHPSSYYLRVAQAPHPEGGVLLTLPTTDFYVSVYAAGHLPQRVGPYEPASVPDPLVVELARAGALRGRVLAGGAPVGGARVHVHSHPQGALLASFDDDLLTRWDSHDGQPLTVETDVDGRFELHLTWPGSPYLLHAEADGFARAEAGPFEVAVGESVDGIELRCTTGATLEGRVRVAEGVPVDGTIVAISRADGHVASTAVGKDGAYRFEHLTPGAWQVRRSTPAKQEWLRVSRADPVYDEALEIEPDVELYDGVATEHDLDLVHELPCSVSGWLALDGAWERGWHARVASGDEQVTVAVEESGAYELKLFGSASVTLSFSSSTPTGGHTQLISKPVPLEGGAQTVSWSAASGSVELADLPPPEPSNGQIRSPGYALLRADAEGWTWSTTFDPDEHGRAAVERVPEGTIELRRRPSSRSLHPTQWPAIATFDVKPNERVRFAPPSAR